jgi:heme/copper-type cytochrome/quinol oxidase subunit 1
MVKLKLARNSAALFTSAAICLFLIGIPTYHSSWPPLGQPGTHFAIGDVGEVLCFSGAAFLFCAVVYFLFPIIFRKPTHRILGQIHFWMSLLAVILDFGMTYWFNLRFHMPKSPSWLATLFQAFGASLEVTAWAFSVFALAQVIFIANLLWSVFKKKIETAAMPDGDTAIIQ